MDLSPAITTLLSDTESSFRAEIQTKQSLVDQAHTKLRETTSLLAQERRQLKDLQHSADERRALRRRIVNLRRANDAQRVLLLNSGHVDKSTLRSDVRVGEADAGLEFDDVSLPTFPPNDPDQQLPLSALTASQQNYLTSLPPAAILYARTRAYKKINAKLEEQVKSLHSQSSELEAQLRKVVSLCTGVDEAKVDEMVEGLVHAVESEGGDDVEVARVREFLRRVENGD